VRPLVDLSPWRAVALGGRLAVSEFRHAVADI
jgi:hypothetical protein